MQKLTWDIRPTLIDAWPDNIRFVMAVDENGTWDLKQAQKSAGLGQAWPANHFERHFTITGAIVARDDFADFQRRVSDLKICYWPPSGRFLYKDTDLHVCFHSREIRKSEGPFATINLADFVSDLTSLIRSTPFTIISANLDKIEYIRRYQNPIHPYNLNLMFIIERFAYFLNEQSWNGIVVIESRGKTEDLESLVFLVNLIKHGNYYYSNKHFSRIKGVYFSRKRSMSSGKSVAILELADLCSYPIHKYARSGIKDQAFRVLEEKFYHYPNHLGHGLKTFP